MQYISAHVRDPGNVPHTLHNLHVTMRDMNSNPPNLAMARKLMSDSVGNVQPENSRINVITAGDYDLQLSGKFSSGASPKCTQWAVGH